MRSLYVFGIVSIVAGFMSALLTLPARAAESSPASIIISEINWAGSGRSSADEWFELANLTGSPIDVSGWIISGVATNAGAITLAEGSSIAPLDTLVVANYTVGDQSTLAVAPDLVTTAVSLPNTKLSLLLATPDGTVVDSVEDPGTPDFGSSVSPIASMERDVATLGWFSASTSVNMLDGQLGSPGAIGSPPTPAPDTEEETSEVAPDPFTTNATSNTTVTESPSKPTSEASTPEVIEPSALHESSAIEPKTPSSVPEDVVAPEEMVVGNDVGIEPTAAVASEDAASASPTETDASEQI